MPKINSNNMDDLEQLQEYGVKIKTRYKKRKLPKVKFNRKKENRKDLWSKAVGNSDAKNS